MLSVRIITNKIAQPTCLILVLVSFTPPLQRGGWGAGLPFRKLFKQFLTLCGTPHRAKAAVRLRAFCPRDGPHARLALNSPDRVCFRVEDCSFKIECPPRRKQQVEILKRLRKKKAVH